MAKLQGRGDEVKKIWYAEVLSKGIHVENMKALAPSMATVKV